MKFYFPLPLVFNNTCVPGNQYTIMVPNEDSPFSKLISWLEQITGNSIVDAFELFLTAISFNGLQIRPALIDVHCIVRSIARIFVFEKNKYALARKGLIKSSLRSLFNPQKFILTNFNTNTLTTIRSCFQIDAWSDTRGV